MFSGKTFYNFAFFTGGAATGNDIHTFYRPCPLSLCFANPTLPRGEPRALPEGAQQKKHCTFLCSVFLSGGDYRAVFDHGDCLQSMRGALPAELIPHSFGVNKKAPHISVRCFFFLVEITGPILITVTLLQSMHGALPGEPDPHSFGSNKKAPHISV